MIAKLVNQLYPKKGDPPKSDGFCIMKYKCVDKDPLAVDDKGEPLYQKDFIVFGRFLPNDKYTNYDLKGRWEQDRKRGDSHFAADTFEAVVEKTKSGILEYLSHGIKGIGPVTAERLYDTFGSDVLDILDKDPTRLREVKGITQKKLDKMITSYLETRASKDLQMELLPLGISMKKINHIYEQFKTMSVDIVKNHPFLLVVRSGLSFKIADEIAHRNNSDLQSPERVEAAIWEVLSQAERGGELFRQGSGSACVEYVELQQKVYQLLNFTVAPQAVVESINSLRRNKMIQVRKDPRSEKWFAFKSIIDKLENDIAKQIVKIIQSYKEEGYDIEEEIRRMELLEHIALAPEQRNAVITALKSGFCVITGGPGTGKTTIIKFIRSIYLKMNKSKNILMCSPTGVAAVRMKESTNGEASTVHKALELKPIEETLATNYKLLDDYDFIIVDETSMLDMYVAYALVMAVKKGSKVCFVGDIDQLPSVGPGAILRDIIESGPVSVARLIKVYRQKDDNLIPLNAQLIKNGKTTLDYGESFQFIPANSFEEAAEYMKNVYLQEINMHGIQNVLMLSPYRIKTASGVNEVNKIRDVVNPPDGKKKEITSDNKLFRQGDKVINTKNVDDICNGDIGFVTNICDKINKDGDRERIVTIDFGHDRVVEFEPEDLENLDWAYATTVHKSQGSEADYVILNIMSGHGFLLKRNLLYTAVTRAKKKVIIIGEQRAIETAILSGVSYEEQRKTLLSQRIEYYYNHPELIDKERTL